MKKISIISVLSILTMPVFAEEVAATQEEVKPDVVEQYNKQFEQPVYQESEKYSNPEAKFPHGMQLGIGVSPTSGLNFFVGYNNKKFDSFWWKRFGFRLDFATYSPIKSRMDSSINDRFGKDGLEINKNLKLDNIGINAKHFGAIIDFYPFGDTWLLGGWRISGGYMTGNLDLESDIHGKETLNGIEFKLGDRTYVYTGDEMKGTANINWDYRGPYLGTGFDLGLFYGFKIYFDAGLVFANNHAQAKLDAPLTSDLKDITSSIPQNISGVLEEEYNKAKAKALSDAQKELDKLGYYPIVKIGFMYRF